jgi:hypothetical protein
MTTTRKLLAAAVAAAVLPTVLAAPAQAGTLTRDGCTATPLRPVHVRNSDFDIKVIDYRINVTCGPDRVFTYNQRVREDDSGTGDVVYASRTKAHRFTHNSGTRTIVIHGTHELPNTENGAEEMYHDLRFRVSSGGVNGSWTARTESPRRAFAN